MSALKVWLSSQYFCHLASVALGSYWGGRFAVMVAWKFDLIYDCATAGEREEV